MTYSYYVLSCAIFINFRELGIPIDSLKLSTSWDKFNANHSRTFSEIMATLSGLYIQGARMMTGSGMEECKIDTPSWNAIPPCYLSWIPADSRVCNQTNVDIENYSPPN